MKDISIKSEKQAVVEENSQKSRRDFLKNIGLGGIGLSVIGSNLGNSVNANALANITELNSQHISRLDLDYIIDNVDDLNRISINAESVDNYTVYCTQSTIATRLFSSSNTSTSDERNRMALERLSCAGFDIANPEVMSRKYYRFGGTDAQRANDFEQLVKNPKLAPKVLLGVRGGYGAMRLLPQVNWQRLGAILRERGTILGGFSDVTAIQCALQARGGMGSFNVPMAYSEFGKYNPDVISCAGFVRAISQPTFSIDTYSSVRTHADLPPILSHSPHRRIAGTMWGGNLSVLSSLSGSDYMPNPRGGIVFIEEVGEQPYRIERMLYDMYLTGAFKNQQAIVFGAMARSGTDGYNPSYNVNAVIRELHRLTGLPIYSGVCFGHVSKKQSFPMGFHCQIAPLNAGMTAGFSMIFSGHPTIDATLIHEPALSMKL